MVESAEELFRDGALVITRDRVVAGDLLLLVRSVSSVRLDSRRTGATLAPVVSGLFGVGILALSLGYVLDGCADAAESRAAGWACLIVGAAIVMWARSYSPVVHSVIVAADGREYAIFTDGDLSRARSALRALQDAIGVVP